jgi:hypothetical protein
VAQAAEIGRVQRGKVSRVAKISKINVCFFPPQRLESEGCNACFWNLLESTKIVFVTLQIMKTTVKGYRLISWQKNVTKGSKS